MTPISRFIKTYFQPGKIGEFQKDTTVSVLHAAKPCSIPGTPSDPPSLRGLEHRVGSKYSLSTETEVSPEHSLVWLQNKPIESKQRQNKSKKSIVFI